MDVSRMIIPFICDDTRNMGYILKKGNQLKSITDSIRGEEFVRWEDTYTYVDTTLYLGYLHLWTFKMPIFYIYLK